MRIREKYWKREREGMKEREKETKRERCRDKRRKKQKLKSPRAEMSNFPVVEAYYSWLRCHTNQYVSLQ